MKRFIKILLILFLIFIFNLELSYANKTSSKAVVSKNLILTKDKLQKYKNGKKYIKAIDNFILNTPLEKLEEVKERTDKFLEKVKLRNKELLFTIRYLKFKLDLKFFDSKEIKVENIYKNKLKETKTENKDIKIKYLTKERFIDLSPMEIEDFLDLEEKIIGKLYRQDIEKIVVRYKNPKYYKKELNYTLKKFSAGDNDFSYNAYKKFKSLNFGKNTYIFEAYAGGEVSKIELEVNLDKKNYCLLDECIPEDAKITIKNGVIIGKILEKYSDKEKSYRFDRKKQIFEKKGEYVYLGDAENIKVFKMGNVFIKNIYDYAFYSDSDHLKYQKIYDLNGKELKNYDLGLGLKNIKIGNLNYKPTIIFDKSYLNKKFKLIQYGFTGVDDKKIINLYDENDLIKELNKKISKGWGYEVPKWFFVEYRKYPGLKVIYKDTSPYIGGAIRTIYLGKDKNYLEKNITKNGDLMDLSVTNKILSYYTPAKRIYSRMFYKFNGYDVIESVEKEYLPIFKVEKFDDNGNYLLYVNDKKIDFCTNKEGLGKPAVYYYSAKEEENKLKLNPKKGDYFSKLIPLFNEKNTWKFKSKDGKIIVENKIYDYLYYSLITFDYKHNKKGYIVYGEDIEKFFDDKLTKINFTKQEKNDFKDFWVEKFKKESYYFVSFKYKEDLDKIIKLKFEKKPSKEFRVLLDTYELGAYQKSFEGLIYNEKNKTKFDKDIIKYFDRGKTHREVFEWGGTLFDLSGQKRVY